ncbi:MAG TPA: ATP-binding protein [Anaeromyxobacter sp.]|nr:ATP-binding protein [Anaeromyxobacter sp.]
MPASAQTVAGPVEAGSPATRSDGSASRRRRLGWTRGRVVAAYALVGALWITFSDRALVLLVRDPGLRERLQTTKGFFFVAVTSLLLLGLIRRLERGLRTLGAEVRATVDGVADAVLLVEGEGREARVVGANRAAVELFGAPREALLGPLEAWGRRVALRYLDGSAVPVERSASVRVLGGEKVAAYDGMVRRDGEDVYVSITSAPVLHPGPRALAVTVIRDVSASRRLDEMRDEFLAIAAHELKTPLAVIRAYAQLLQRRVPAETQALTVIQRQVDRLNRLVQQLLDTSRLRLEAPGAAPARFDLGELVRAQVERAQAEAPGHVLSVDGERAAVVVADRPGIARVLASLLDNAVRFSPAGGEVQTRVDVRQGEAVVSVADRGVGIAPERQGRVFERYYRAHAGTGEDYGGLGLGLDLSQAIVSRHGGRMWFESAPGVGSTFHFSLPLAGGAER